MKEAKALSVAEPESILSPWLSLGGGQELVRPGRRLKRVEYLIDTTEFRRGIDEATNRTHEMLRNLSGESEEER
jgi:hypothetical protein